MTSVGDDLGARPAPEDPEHDRPDGAPSDAPAEAPVADADRGADAPLERRTRLLTQQWATLRKRRLEAIGSRRGPLEVTGSSNLRRAEVPWGLDLAAAWSWRLLLIAGAGYLVLWLLAYFAVVTLPLAISLLIAALVSPAVSGLRRIGVPKALGALLVVLVGLGALVALLTFVGRQVADGASDLADQTAAGLGQVREWVQTGPLGASDTQINDWLGQAQAAVVDTAQDGAVLARVTEFGLALGHVVAGMFIVLFATYFFLADGARIWSWVVRIAPRDARRQLDGSGRVAWVSLTRFVRATVIIALADSIGIMIWAAVLDVPLVAAIGVLVFLGAFVPMVGATVAGGVAVLVALVAHGPLTALLMLVGVIVVQQIEGHLLQPFLTGRFVSVHPLGVIVAIGCGVLVAGIAGALIAVPLVAALNAVVHHLAGHDVDPGPVGDEPEKVSA
ncbi:AI-2E family transporter [Nocardioides sp. CFH 31398]|uniref:AI-2E family transporter n=1 Tax=Nocardioides sp. CFH 31398 TaxID=2919579 RepID=UPI001F054C81|nr:AI-2E family transporter [Nocardioides sp. CFH 31398]MCH1868159.1 AI-2E family transporter [Nocardioides sp. CFH 31398]